MGAVELERQGVELLERAVVIDLGPCATQANLDRLTVALGEMIEDVAFLVLLIATSR